MAYVLLPNGSIVNETDGGLLPNGGVLYAASGSVTHSATASLSADAATLSATASRTGAAVSHSATASLTADSATLSASASRSSGFVSHAATASLTSGSATLSASAARSSSGTATIVTPALKNNTGTVLASISGWTVNVYNQSTGALVVQKTGLSTDAGGVLTINDAALSASTTYTYEPVHATYGRRLPTGTAS